MDLIKRLTDKYAVRFSEDSLQEFASLLEKRTYQKDELIVEQGKISRHLYVIEKGIIRQFYYKEGRDITEHFSCEGDVAACLESLFLKEPARLLAEAVEPSVIHLLNYERWKAFCHKNPELNELYQRVVEHKLIVSQRKADSWRFESAHDRYARFCREYPGIARRASVGHIASYLLMTPETLSRVRAGVL